MQMPLSGIFPGALLCPAEMFSDGLSAYILRKQDGLAVTAVWVTDFRRPSEND